MVCAAVEDKGTCWCALRVKCAAEPVFEPTPIEPAEHAEPLAHFFELLI